MTNSLSPATSMFGWALIFYGGFCLSIFSYAVVARRVGREEFREVFWPLASAVIATVVGLNMAFPDTAVAQLAASFGFTEDLLFKILGVLVGFLFALPGLALACLGLYLPYKLVTEMRHDGFNGSVLFGALMALVTMTPAGVQGMILGVGIGMAPFQPPMPGSPAALALEAKARQAAAASGSHMVAINTTSKKYHEPGCRYFDCNKCVQVSVEEAQRQQGVPCRRCH